MSENGTNHIFQAAEPYNQLPPLPPGADIETRAILRRCAPARAALAELKAACELVPDPAILINTLPVLEAQASSEIENIVTTGDKLFEAARLSEASADPATKEALHYRTALFQAYHTLDTNPLGTDTAVTICSIIKDTAMHIRTRRVIIAGGGGVRYTPPEGEALLRDILTNWQGFMHGKDELDPLVRMAVAHYQFEAIHPFMDGNGRTGRIINSLFFVERGLLPLPVLYLSRYILANRPDYYARLLAVTRDGAWEPWILYMLDGVEETATWTRHKINAIRGLMREAAERMRDVLPKIYSRELVDVIFTQPYCRIGDVVDAGIAKRETASEYLKKLVEAGMLEERTVGRDKLFLNRQLLRLLEE